MYAHDEMQAPAGMVCLLLRSLYGLKQAPRNWNGHLHDFIMDLGFHQTPQDPCLYVHTIENHIVFMAVFVDDILLASRSSSVLAIVKAAFQDRFTKASPRNFSGFAYSKALARSFLISNITARPSSETSPTILAEEIIPRYPCRRTLTSSSHTNPHLSKPHGCPVSPMRP